MQTPRVQFKIAQSPIENPIDLSSSTIQSTPSNASQQNTSKLTSDYSGEPNLVNDPLDISSDTTLSLLCHYLPSTLYSSQISQTPFLSIFPTNLDARYRENLTNNIPLRLDWNTFVAPPPLFDQHHEINTLHNWALNR